MHVGIPKEVKDNEYRVAATPEGVRELVAAGHRVVVEASAGRARRSPTRSSPPPAPRSCPTPTPSSRAEMIVKVKEPQPEEYERFREGQVLFTYLHLAADEGLTRFLAERRRRRRSPTRPCRRPTGGCRCSRRCRRSPVAWRRRRARPRSSVRRGGRGVLMGGASGVAPARVVVLGAGMAGANAAQIAAGMEAEVTVVDRNVDRLREIDRVWHGRIQTVMSSALGDRATRARGRPGGRRRARAGSRRRRIS